MNKFKRYMSQKTNSKGALAVKGQLYQLHNQVKKVTPAVYASLAIALHRKYGWGYKRINDLFLLSQDIWAESTCKSENMLQMCFNETGIELREE